MPQPGACATAAFDEVVGNRFALVTSSPLSDCATKGAQQPRSRGRLRRVGQRTRQLAEQGRATAAIVRPDRAVMQAGRNVAAIFDARARLLHGSRRRT